MGNKIHSLLVTAQYIGETFQLAETLRSETDRGAALVGCALLDDMLAAAIERKFVAEVAAQLLKEDYEYVRMRAMLARGVGLLSAAEYTDALAIIAIRNEAAHIRVPFTFDGSDKGGPKFDLVSKTAESRLTRRNRFEFVVVQLSQTLWARSQSAVTRPEEPEADWLEYHHQFSDQWLGLDNATPDSR